MQRRRRSRTRACFFSAFPQIEATLLRSAECEEVQRVAECCWHLAWRTSEPRRRLWQGHRRKHKWELMAPLFRVIRRARHHIFFFRDGTTERSWRRVWRKEEGDVENTCVCVWGGKNRAEVDIIKTQASVSPHNVAMGNNWGISHFKPETAFHASLHKHTSLSLTPCECKF